MVEVELYKALHDTNFKKEGDVLLTRVVTDIETGLCCFGA